MTPEEARIAAVQRYNILDTPPEESFDELARVAALVCGTPVAVISIIDKARQWFKARVGMDATETPRSIAFCDHAIKEPNNVLVVPDATSDPRFSDHPLVTGDAHIRFYAGAPLVTPDGFALGTICAVGQSTKTLTPEQTDAMAVLAKQVIAQLELRRGMTELAIANAKLQELVEQGRLPPEIAVRVCAWTRTVQIGSGPWQSIEEFIQNTVGVRVVHGISPEAMRALGWPHANGTSS